MQWWRVVGAVGRFMMRAGVLVLLFVAYQLWGTGLSTQRAQNDLENQFEAQLATAPSTSSTASTSPTVTVPTGPTSTLPPATAPTDLPTPENGDPIALTDTPPEVFVVSEDETCDPDGAAVKLDLVRAPYEEDGTVYDTWWITGGVVQAIVPADPKCLPAKDGSNWAIVGYADTAADNGPDDGQVGGAALDQRIGEGTTNPLYKLVK